MRDEASFDCEVLCTRDAGNDVGKGMVIMESHKD
jgi:hypothetical protein